MSLQFVPAVDENLPSVPPLTVVLPHNYPTLNPICNLNHYKQSSVPFLREVGALLSDKLARKVGMCSLCTLLDFWEVSVLMAMSKVLNAPDED